MIAVIIGTGEWRDVAFRSAERITKLTGLEAHVINEQYQKLPEAVHPSWLKCHVLDMLKEKDDFLVLDADIFCCQKWDPKGLFESLGKPFCAVQDNAQGFSNGPFVLQEMKEFGFPEDWIYVNGGFCMFNRQKHRMIWNDVWARHPSCGRWLEQTSLNLSLHNNNAEVCRLPKRFNQIVHWSEMKANSEQNPFELAQPEDINIHLTKSTTIKALSKLFDWGEQRFPV